MTREDILTELEAADLMRLKASQVRDLVRRGQRRRTVAEVLVAVGPSGKPQRATARLSCGHVVFRTYSVAVGQTAYCAACGEAS